MQRLQEELATESDRHITEMLQLREELERYKSDAQRLREEIDRGSVLHERRDSIEELERESGRTSKRPHLRQPSSSPSPPRLDATPGPSIVSSLPDASDTGAVPPPAVAGPPPAIAALQNLKVRMPGHPQLANFSDLSNPIQEALRQDFAPRSGDWYERRSKKTVQEVTCLATSKKCQFHKTEDREVACRYCAHNGHFCVRRVGTDVVLFPRCSSDRGDLPNTDVRYFKADSGALAPSKPAMEYPSK
jgi:hypothetical protein